MARLKRLFLLTLLLLVLGVITLVGIPYASEDEIIAEFQSTINEQLTAPVGVGSLDFSLLSDFPRASIVLHDVSIQDGLDSTQNLLEAKRVSLEFGIIDLIQKRYIIDNISVADGRYVMHRDATDRVNYIFWKSSDEENPEMRFELQAIELSNITYSYVDEMAEVSIASQVDKGTMSGLFSEGWMNMRVRLNGSETDLLIDGAHYLEQNSIKLLGELKVKQDASDILFEDCILTVGDIEIPFGGRVHEEEQWMVNLNLAGEADLKEFFKQLPSDQKGTLDRYALAGNATYKMSVVGATTGGALPLVKMDFELSDGAMELRDADTRMRDMTASGLYQRSTAGVDEVRFDSFTASLPQGEVKYTGTIYDFDRLVVKGRLRANSNLEDVLALVEQETIMQGSGYVALDIRINGALPTGGHVSSKQIDQLDMRGSINLSDIQFTLSESGYVISDLETIIQLKRDRLSSESIALEIDGQALNGTIALEDFWPYTLSDKATLKVRSVMHAEAIDLGVWTTSDDTDVADAEPFTMPERIELDMDLRVDQLNRESFTAEDVSLALHIDEKTIRAQGISLKTAKGTAQGDIALANRWGGKWHLAIDADLRQVDLPTLFRQSEQFGQDFLLDSHIRGTGRARVKFAAMLSPSLDLDPKLIVCDADVTVHQGELVEHPAMSDMITVLKDKNLLRPFVRADELEEEMHHLQFSTLTNAIHISDGMIRIPSMHIANNSVDIDIAGSHSFEQEIDYRLDFNLRDIMLISSHPDFYIEDDGLGHILHIRMTGTTDDPIIALDRDAVREGRKEALAQAKFDIKALTRGAFKSSGSEEDSDERSAVKVQIEGVTDGDKKDSKSTGDKKNSKGKKKRSWAITPDVDEVEFTDDGDDF